MDKLYTCESTHGANHASCAADYRAFRECISATLLPDKYAELARCRETPNKDCANDELFLALATKAELKRCTDLYR